MTEFGKRLIVSTEQALDIAKGTAVPGAYRVSVYEDGELRVVSDIDEAGLSIDEKPAPQPLKERPPLENTGN